MSNGLTTHHPLSLLTNLLTVNHITETKPDHEIYENCSNMISLMGRVSHYPKKEERCDDS
jgi:hypothetical protein